MKCLKDQPRWMMTKTILLLSLSLVMLHSARAQDTPDMHLATVNGIAITQNDLDREFNRVKMQAASQQRNISESDISAIKEKIIETLITRELLYQESRAKGIRVEKAEVEDSVEKIKQRLTPGKSFAQALVEIKVSQKEFENEIEKAIMIQKLMDSEIYQKISISDKETRVFYDNNPQFFKKPEQVRASHILIRMDAQADEAQQKEARKRMADIQLKLRQGEDFAKLAEQFSECPSGQNGGDLGVFDRKKMVKPFSDAAFSLAPGETSDIVETQFGLHIIKVFEKTPESKMMYADIKERLTQTMRQRQIQQETSVYIDQLKKAASIQRTAP